MDMHRLKRIRISLASQLQRPKQLQGFDQAGNTGRGSKEVSQEAVQEVLVTVEEKTVGSTRDKQVDFEDFITDL